MATAPTRADYRDSDVVAYKAFTGLRNDVDPERFELTDLNPASNCDLDKSGRLSRRAGYTQQIAGASHSLWASDNLRLALYVAGTQLLKTDTSYATTVLRSGLTAHKRMSYAAVNDRAYFNNGAELGVVENGAARTWGMPVPPYPGVVLGTGYMPAGSYQFVTTYQRKDGQESGARLAARIEVPVGGALAFTLAAPVDADITTHNIYLSTTNGEKLYLALQVPVTMTSATYTGDTSEFAYDLKTQFLSGPPAGHLLAYYKGRVFVAADDVIYPSEPHAYELFDLRKYIPMDGRVTLMAPWEDKELYDKGRRSGFFLGTDRSQGILVGSDPDDFQYVPKSDYGAVLGALDYVDGSLFGDNSTGAKELPVWLSLQGLCVGMPDLEIRNLTRTKYGFPVGGQGAAVFMPGSNRFIATSF